MAVVGMHSYIKLDDRYYFYSRSNLGICCYDSKLNKLQTRIANTGRDSSFRYSDVVEYNGKLIFAPFDSSRICIYDISNDKCDYIETSEPLRTLKALRYKDEIYFLSKEKKEIFILKMGNYSIRTFELVDYPNMINDIYYTGDVLYVVARKKDSILKINLKTEESNTVTIDNAGCCFSTICYDGTAFWITGDKEYIIKWNEKSNHVDKLYFEKGILNVNYVEGGRLFSASRKIMNYVFLSPFWADSIVRLNMNNGELNSVFRIPNGYESRNIMLWGDELLYFNIGDKNLDYSDFVIDPDGNIIKKNIFDDGTETNRETFSYDLVDFLTVLVSDSNW